MREQIHLIFPVGTQVVTRAETSDVGGLGVISSGEVGEVTVAPSAGEGLYTVRFLSGREGRLGRADLAIRKQVQREGLGYIDRKLAEQDFTRFVIFRCVVGSRAFGLENEHSDTDRRGIFLPPADLHWSLGHVPEQFEIYETQDAYWELEKFMLLALKANPNVLECLYTPLVELATPLARQLLDDRTMFLSKLVYLTYNGYVMSQFRKIEQDLRTVGAIKWKHAMHLIRLLLSGVTVLREGFVPVRVDEHRDRLLAIRAGEVPFESVNRWRLELHEQFAAAYESSTLPDQPDWDRANDFLVAARRMMV